MGSDEATTKNGTVYPSVVAVAIKVAPQGLVLPRSDNFPKFHQRSGLCWWRCLGVKSDPIAINLSDTGQPVVRGTACITSLENELYTKTCSAPCAVEAVGVITSGGHLLANSHSGLCQDCYNMI